MKIVSINTITLRSFFKNNYSFIFIGINIIVALLGFIRSFFFMKLFSFNELGIITIINTGVMFIGFFQIGLINGGYRIIALKNEDSTEKTNNVIFSYFGVISVFLFGVYLLVVLTGYVFEYLYVFVAILIGLFTLIVNWLTNILIGNKEYKRLNSASFISAIVGLLSLILAYFFDIYGAILSLFLQPIVFVLIVFITDSKVLPKKFDLDIKYIKHVLSFGFIPFLSGVFLLIYMQVERWSIIYFIGPEALGKMYLVFIISMLWVLIPSSINSLFFPDAVKLFVNNDSVGLSKMINKYYLIISIYCFLISFLILVFLNPFVHYFFPNHLPYVYLAIMILPALILRTMSDPIILLLNSMVILKPLFWGDLICIFIYIILVLTVGFTKKISLDYMIICLGIYYLCRFIYLLNVFIYAKKKLLKS